MANGYGRRNDRQESSEVSKIISKIRNLRYLSEMKPKDYADEGGYADLIAKEFSGRGGDNKVLNTNQLRKFFGAIRDIESKEGDWEDIESQFYLLKPKLAVSAGRKLIPKKFHELMMTSMNKVDIGDSEVNLENFKTLVNFLEAIVAYRKYYD
ncbi:MAG: type III-A CRISPR-associated protein Csm2 [Methanobrevibacter sp.]|jgi:CRISPR-associated protein Csm2|nr:type III-A CRISPR-associated protein Csm2 [Methanobrevibacter sp.]